MNGRFEVLTLSEAQCLIRFSDSDDTVLLASSAIPGLDLAERTIEWLRSALVPIVSPCGPSAKHITR